MTFSDIERVIVDFYEAHEVPVNEAGGEWFVAGDGQFSLTALAIAIAQALGPVRVTPDLQTTVDEIAARSPGVPKATIRQLLAASDAVAVETRWRHRKRGTEYVEIGKAGLQSADAVYEPATLVIYCGADGQLWARPKAEFEDGRFELLEGNHG